jgi:hypothetical protein
VVKQFPGHEQPCRTDKVVFADGSTSDYRPPVNTLDPRYEACTDHRVGCDCREADLREDIVDIRAEWQGVRKALTDVLAGHPGCCCRCPGCEIARRLHLTHLASGEHCRD